jgi:hypothetical protein
MRTDKHKRDLKILWGALAGALLLLAAVVAWAAPGVSA